jgi:hypothetical protein
MAAWRSEITLPRTFRTILVLQMAILGWLFFSEPEQQYRRLSIELGRSDVADLMWVIEIVLPLTTYIALVLLRRWGRLLLIPTAALGIVMPLLAGLYCREGPYGTVVLSGFSLAAVAGTATKSLDGALLALAWGSDLTSSFIKETHKGVPFLVVGAALAMTLIAILLYLGALGAGMTR